MFNNYVTIVFKIIRCLILTNNMESKNLQFLMSEIKTARPRIPSPLTAGMIMSVKSVQQLTLDPVYQNL